MSKPKLDNIWLEDFQGVKALRADFNNGRCHRVVISWPHGNEEVAQALIDLAFNIGRDKHLSDLGEVK